MARLRLRHLTFVGTSVEPATVAFGDNLTLIRGPSDTGKSFIVDAIDFMMGANSLKDIPERLGYSTALLGVELPSGDVITLSRSVTGGRFGVYQEDVRSGSLDVPPLTLSPTHSPTSEGNVSRFFLSATGLDGRRVRRNVKNDTDSLSFRNIAHLCIVDETQMQSDTPPALTGHYVTRTKEVSVLKLLLQDEDDSDLIPAADTTETKRTARAKVEVVDGLLADLAHRLADAPSEPEIRDQLARLNDHIATRTNSIDLLTSRRSELVRRRSAVQDDIIANERRTAEATALIGRFNLLLAQYDSDLERLEMLSEAGSLLGYFDRGTCVFCGAEVEHQHLNEDGLALGTHFGESVSVERTKTSALRGDLIATIADLEIERVSLQDGAENAQAELARADAGISDVETELAPHREGLSELLDLRRSLDATLSMHDQVAELEELKARVGIESKAEAATVAASLNIGVLTEFATEVRRCLEAWRFPDASDVRYDRSEQDLIVGDQVRAAHGKGVRAILHAAFTTALCQYCLDREIHHPGFVILDSPLVTYRAPDEDESAATIEAGVADAFYRDIQDRFSGQIIVMENTDPATPLGPESVDITFTKVESTGRYGFFPVRP